MTKINRDVMTPEQRSALMGRIRGKDTGPEMLVASLLRPYRFVFERHAADLPGRPDFVFRSRMIAVFVDGDFWHGWHFPRWRGKLTPFWREKISRNRERDQRNMARLRRAGWRVVRVWEHQIKRDPQGAVDRVVSALRSRPPFTVADRDRKQYSPEPGRIGR